MPRWRAEFYANSTDNHPSRFDTIDGESEDEAAEKAAQLMSSSEMRVDVTRTIVKKK